MKNPGVTNFTGIRALRYGTGCPGQVGIAEYSGMISAAMWVSK